MTTDIETADTLPVGPLVKVCGCGRTFSAHEWSLLHCLGSMVDEEGTIELRNCPCGSTIAVEIVIAT